MKRIFYSKTRVDATYTMIFICSIHGNEIAGYKGLHRVINFIEQNNITLGCNFYALIGNISAYKHNVRFIDKDLNRLWTKDHIKNLYNKTNKAYSEAKEQIELLHCIKTILNSHRGTFVFNDIHTTSSPTIPFITINDSLDNRTIASKFSLPIILGIEEYLDGPLLTYLNEFGHMALGFEAGQHNETSSIENSEAFIWLMLAKMNFVSKELIPIHKFKKRLQVHKSHDKFYEINFRYGIDNPNAFKMQSGFFNFAKVTKGTVLATHHSKPVKAKRSGRVFLPLYQNQGEDGFFIISKVSKIWLVLSRMLRKLKLSFMLRLLPGVKQDPNNSYVLIVNPKIARFFVIKLFHLFGFRQKILKGERYYFIRRDRETTTIV